MKQLKEIITDIFLVDIDVEARTRKNVDARRVYAKIMREFGYKYNVIGESIGKTHATILHYVKSLDEIIEYDSNLKEKYLLARSNFILQGDFFKDKKPDLLSMNIIVASEQIKCFNKNKEIVKDNLSTYLNSFEELDDSFIVGLKEVLSPLLDGKLITNETGTQES